MRKGSGNPDPSRRKGRKDMAIIYAGEIGGVLVSVDENGIQFVDGTAYFSDVYGKDYAIPVEDIREIVKS